MVRNKLSVRLIYPSSGEEEGKVQKRIVALQKLGCTVFYDENPRDIFWPQTASTIDHRAQTLVNALCEQESDVIMAARGGYGASDLLPSMPWTILKNIKPKWFVGFSDISALHCGFYTKLGWKTLMHGSFDGEEGWEKRADFHKLFALLQGRERDVRLQLDGAWHFDAPNTEREGLLFGGCLSVLTNLIGTPYGPQNLADHILFLEDLNETPAKLMRQWNQWIQSGLLEGVQAVVIGDLQNTYSPLSQQEIKKEFFRRSGLPVYSTSAFGHGKSNVPLLEGARARIIGSEIRWSF